MRYRNLQYLAGAAMLGALWLFGAGVAGAQTTVGPFTFTPTSSSGVLIGKITIDGVPASSGDIVGVFDSDGNTAGAKSVTISGGEAFINVAIYGDDTTTPGVDEGMDGGESFTLKLYDESEGETLDGPTVSGWQNTNGSPIPGLDSADDIYDFEGALTAPAAPALSSPADGAVGISVPASLEWTASTDAADYDVEVSTSAGFGSTVFSANATSATSASATGLDLSTEYYWRVRANNAAGNSAWSTMRSFTTRAPSVPAAPGLTSPVDEATGVGLTAELDWSSVTDATSYQLQVSTTESFGSLVEDIGGLGSTSRDVTLDEYLQTYYWRVRATGVAGTGPWSDVYSFETEAPPPPTAPALSEPADAATGVGLSPTVSWNASPLADSYEVQVSEQASFSSTVVSAPGISALSLQVNGLSTITMYYWRVRASNAGGTGEWSAVRSFTTVLPSAPGITIPAMPEDGSTGEPTELTLSWDVNPDAQTYQLQLSTSADFTTALQTHDDLTTTSFEATGLFHLTTYFWRVRAKNAGGDGPYSDTFSFTTVIEQPATPAPVTPADGADDQALSLELVYSAADRAATYDVQVSTDTRFSSLVLDETGLTGTEVQLSGLENTTAYHWRVRGVNAGGVGEWSAVATFTTIVAAPGPPVPVAPADDAQNQMTSLELSWNPGPGAASTELQVATDVSFTALTVARTELAGTSEDIAGLDHLTTYYWRVRSRNAGGFSGWSDVRSFTTIIEKPGVSVLTSPDNGADGLPVLFDLHWAETPRADTYDVQLATEDTFANVLLDAEGLTAQSANISDLDHLTTYYWRVRARNVGGTGAWSATWSFTTGPPAPPPTPTLATPLNGSTDLPVIVQLAWTAAARAVDYSLQIATDDVFTHIVTERTGLPEPNVRTDSLDFDQVYFWRVRAGNPGGQSPWSTSRSFQTEELPAPPRPLLSGPQDKVTSVDSHVTLSWEPVAIAESYDIQVSRFGQIVVDTTKVRETSLAVEGLRGATEYFWRVRARNAAGIGSRSISFSFTTAVFTGIDSALQPGRFALHPPYPNPATRSAIIPYDLTDSGPVRIMVYDTLGRLKSVVVDDVLPAGTHRTSMRVGGPTLSSGTYLVRIVAGENSAVRALIVAR